MDYTSASSPDLSGLGAVGGAMVGCYLLFLLVALAIVILIYWKLFSKAGYSGWLSLLMMVPLVNFGMILFLAFSDWPVLKELRDLRARTGYVPPGAGGYMPPPAPGYTPPPQFAPPQQFAPQQQYQQPQPPQYAPQQYQPPQPLPQQPQPQYAPPAAPPAAPQPATPQPAAPQPAPPPTEPPAAPVPPQQ